MPPGSERTEQRRTSVSRPVRFGVLRGQGLDAYLFVLTFR
jgi:hypothetical protein